jgi:hypothetical protein
MCPPFVAFDASLARAATPTDGWGGDAAGAATRMPVGACKAGTPPTDAGSMDTKDRNRDCRRPFDSRKSRSSWR